MKNHIYFAHVFFYLTFRVILQINLFVFSSIAKKISTEIISVDKETTKTKIENNMSTEKYKMKGKEWKKLGGQRAPQICRFIGREKDTKANSRHT